MDLKISGSYAESFEHAYAPISLLRFLLSVCQKSDHLQKNGKNKTQLLKYIIENLDDRSERKCQWRKDLYEKDDKSIGFETYPVLYLFNAVGYPSEIRSIGRIFLCESFSVLLIRLKRVKSA